MRPTTLLAATLPALALAAPAPIPDASSPTSAQIYDISFSGSGCPNDDTKASTNVLADSLSVRYAGFSGDSTANCQVHLQAKGAGAGWQVAVKSASASGDVYLKPGTELSVLNTLYYSQNAKNTITLSSKLSCPSNGDLRDSFSVSQSADYLVWGPCTGADGYTGILNLNTRPVISGNAGTFNIRSATYNFVWRKC